MQQWLDEAPSNIALIKYMGKKNSETNLPENPSLSYTIEHLKSQVVLELSDNPYDSWEPLKLNCATLINLSSEAQERFLKHLVYLKNYFKIKINFIVRSNNNFPHSSGIASSASSFAALTKCAIKAFCSLTKESMPTIEKQAFLSRIGSGSSCRSFFSPWALWDEDKITSITIPYHALHHEVIIISRNKKSISSSLAHKLIKTSPFYKGRSARASTNLKELIQSLTNKNWEDAYKICWQEFQDMHQLFSSCRESFTYINDDSKTVLNQLQEFWRTEQDGPIITMDAGPNIHLLYRADQLELANEFRKFYLKGNFDVL